MPTDNEIKIFAGSMGGAFAKRMYRACRCRQSCNNGFA
ncbi:hypothetical protein CLORY_31570 [Clostridium oryzae]|uniref:Uncharacterized protein n=1 Tax=Clostridium oryzae TaxID=1450648 RepID=A0A1V4IIH2_9CLOT|nr:hypothetical protein CLORY_31570 [Clostridium oryzae]